MSTNGAIPAFELLEMFDTRTVPGIRVTAKLALTVGPFFRVVSMLARDVAKVPLKVYRVKDDGSREQLRTHPVAKLLRLKPNPDMTAYNLKCALVWNAILHGDGYAYVRRNGAGTPIELWPIESPLVTPERDRTGSLTYRVTVQRSSGLEQVGLQGALGVDDVRVVQVPVDDMIHVKVVTSDGISGMPLWKVAREDIAAIVAIRRFVGALFRNYARPGMALIFRRNLNDQAMRAIREAFERMYSAENAHRVAVLSGDVDVKTFQINSREAEMTDTLLMALRNIAAFGNVPSSKLGDPTRTSYASLEAEMTAYLSEALDPILVALEQEMTAKLLSTAEQEDTYIEFERGALVRTDLESRYRAYTQGIQAGFLTRNEVRAKESLNPLPDGDRAFVPLNVGLTPSPDAQHNTESEDGIADAMPSENQVSRNASHS